MKVCTDACLFGAWVADKIKHSTINNTLDIGCGTGLLSLMLAQKINTVIDAVEINNDAAMQASENISVTPWVKNIKVVNISLQDFIPSKKYDLIISNPPFYENDLRSGNENKDAAKHDATLRLDELLSFVNINMEEDGVLALLLPFHRTGYFERLANESGLFIIEQLLVRQSPKHDHFRSLLLLSKANPVLTTVNELCIHDHERNYTDEFQNLLRDYYLIL